MIVDATWSRVEIGALYVSISDLEDFEEEL
jgi:hypothetical protein